METQVKNSNLNKAKKEKNDEFYTQYHDIEKEINAYLEYDANTFRGKTVLLPCDDPEWSNFIGLKKLGKIVTVDVDINGDGVIDIDDLKWEYLEGSGDFRSDEVKQLRSEADIIVTNPPFSLFREFFDWVMEGQLKFAVIANKNCVTYKNVFNYIKDNEIWSGKTRWSNEMRFKNDGEMKSVSAIWITNLEHGRRHQPMQLMTMADNKKFNQKVIKNPEVYQKYDNYNAIEVSFTDAIPSDYDEIMGVPISFLDKYCPEQFKILGITESQGVGLSNGIWDSSSSKKHPLIDGNKMYARVFIKHKNI